jgi:prepilin-type N-terminal cleavage/methylation domain-containing protein
MIKNKTDQKTAFSLVELSAVLIIIGLLVAGISSGKSLVKTSKLSAARSLTFSSQITTIPGMVLWVEPTMKDSFLTTQIVDSSQLTIWYNREPSGYLTKNNLTTAASANLIYDEVSINDLPAIKTASNGDMTLSSFSGSVLSAATIAIVFKPTVAPSSTAMVIADSGASGNATASIGIKNDRVALNFGSSVETSTVTNPASFALNGQYVLVVYLNGSSSKVFVNNTTEVGGAGAVLAAGSNALNGLTLGANKSGTTGITAEISEVIIYNRVLKDTERQDLMGYLAKKYKITVTGV